MFGTRAGDSDGRFLEDLDGVEYDGLFIFEENAYGLIPDEVGAAFGIEQMNKFKELWRLREERFEWHNEFQLQLEDSGIVIRVIFSGNITRHPMLHGHEYRIQEAGLGACDQIMEQGIMLPCHPTMTREDCEVEVSDANDVRLRGATVGTHYPENSASSRSHWSINRCVVDSRPSMIMLKRMCRANVRIR
ncbi:MAG: DegT/DnrJ/EryC1/StrS family aminotransferase [Myxococcota bacterium]|nr:DegT/DnrJ/EryC1/StrS family aminotransferase [Myxococcota bacterium]